MIKWLLKLCKILIINMSVLVLLFSVCEITVRSYAHFLMEGKSFFREKSFICPWITSYDSPPPMMISSEKGIFRYRDDSINISKKSDFIRIITVGGSTMLNKEAFRSSGIDIASELNKLLLSDTSKLNFEVLNAGADAYSSAQSLINIQFRLMEFQPDIIILMHSINDRTVNYFGEISTGDYSNKYMQEFFINPELLTGLSLSGLLYQSRLLSALGLPQLIAKKRTMNFNNRIDRGISYFIRNLTNICIICKKNNVELILLTQPHKMKNFMFDDEPNHIISYNNVIRDVAEKEDVNYIDMFHEFGHDPELFIDPVHYSEKGVIKFSQILLPEIIKIINLKIIKLI